MVNDQIGKISFSFFPPCLPLSSCSLSVTKTTKTRRSGARQGRQADIEKQRNQEHAGAEMGTGELHKDLAELIHDNPGPTELSIVRNVSTAKAKLGMNFSFFLTYWLRMMQHNDDIPSAKSTANAPPYPQELPLLGKKKSIFYLILRNQNSFDQTFWHIGQFGSE